MQNTKALDDATALSSLSSRLINNYDLTKFEFDVKDVKQKSYIDFICKRNLAYNAAKNNNIKDFIVRYNNYIMAIPSLADRATKQCYKTTMLAKNEHFFEFIHETLLRINSDNTYNKSGIFLPNNVRINMLENYLFNSCNFNHNSFGPDDMVKLNAMACLVNSLLLAASSNALASEEAIAINSIIASVVSKKIVNPAKAAIENMIKQDVDISNETKNNIINNTISVTNTLKKSLS